MLGRILTGSLIHLWILIYSHWPRKPFRNSHRKCSVENGVIKKVEKFTGKYLCQSLFFNNAVRPGLRPATLLKKKLRHRCFPVKSAKFLRTPFLYNTSSRLLLILYCIENFTLYVNSVIWKFFNLKGLNQCILCMTGFLVLQNEIERKKKTFWIKNWNIKDI